MKTRIAKFIAASGAASRRQAEELIASGAVSVNGAVVPSPVFFVDDGDVVCINGAPIAPGRARLYAFHKPVDTMTTRADPAGRRTIYDCLPAQYRNLKYVGRLDFKTTGLLLLTNDGALARRLTLPSSGVRRVYIATVGVKNAASVELDRARAGITVDGIKYAPMKIDDIGGGRLRVEITEGKKNEVRIVLAACGAPVRKLHRVLFGNVSLGNLAPGQIREINQKTIDEMLKSL